MTRGETRLAYLLFFLYKGVLAPVVTFMPVFLEDKGIRSWQAGILLGLGTIMGLVVVLPAGYLADRIQPRRLIMVSLVLGGAALAALVATRDYPLLLVLFILLGLSRNIFQVGFDTLFVRQVIRGEGCMPAGRYYVVVSAAAVAGLMATGAALLHLSLPWLYGGAAVVLMAATVLALRMAVSPLAHPHLDDYRRSLLNPVFAGMALVLFIFSLHWGAEESCYGLFLRHYHGASHAWSSLYMLAEYLALGGSAVATGWLVDRRGANLRHLFAAGLLISGSALILKVTPSFSLSLALRMLHGTGDGVVMVVILFGISRIFGLATMGGSVSLVTFILVLGTFTGSLLFSRLGAALGYEVPFIVTGAALALTALAMTVAPLLTRRDAPIGRR